jgi:hypothetical protein
MPNLLVLYEIADKASRVTSKKSYREYEKWVKSVVASYRDAVVERVARTHLIKLKDQLV